MPNELIDPKKPNGESMARDLRLRYDDERSEEETDLPLQVPAATDPVLDLILHPQDPYDVERRR